MHKITNCVLPGQFRLEPVPEGTVVDIRGITHDTKSIGRCYDVSFFESDGLSHHLELVPESALNSSNDISDSFLEGLISQVVLLGRMGIEIQEVQRHVRMAYRFFQDGIEKGMWNKGDINPRSGDFVRKS